MGSCGCGPLEGPLGSPGRRPLRGSSGGDPLEGVPWRGSPGMGPVERYHGGCHLKEYSEGRPMEGVPWKVPQEGVP
jgi:hypothetical protein